MKYATYLIYIILWEGMVFGGAGYAVFQLGHSGWWMLAAVFIGGCTYPRLSSIPGKPAMPTPDIDSQHSQVDYGGGRFTQSHGLTKREHFAGLAMQGMISSNYYSEFAINEDDRAGSLARRAISHADALLKQLGEGNE